MMRKSTLILLTFAVGLLLPGALPVRAEDLTELSLMDLLNMQVAVASSKTDRTKETVFNSASTVSVIDRETIEKYNFFTVSEALELVPGISVWRTYLKKRIPTVRGVLQEHYANRVLVMINGVPSWNAVTGEGDLDRVGIDDVERIEVLKGPASVIYGSNAFAGAINIVLRQSQKPAGELTGALGSGGNGFSGLLGTQRSGGYYSTANDNSSLFFSAHGINDVWPEYTYQDEAGASVRVNEYNKVNNFTFNGGYKNSSLLINSALVDESYLGISDRITSGAGKDHKIEMNMASYAYTLTRDKLNLRYALTYDWQRRNPARSADANTRSDIVGSRLVNSITSDMALSNVWNLTLGADHEARRSYWYNTYNAVTNVVSSENNMTDRSVTEWSAFSQIGYNSNPFRVLVGARQTQNQNFGSNISARGTMVYTINKNNSVKLIAGQSYRSPSLFELYYITPLPLTVFGNPDLKPEKSDSVELAYLTSIGRFFIQAVGYYSKYSDIITREKKTVVYQGVSYLNIPAYTNIGSFAAIGSEVEVRYVLPKTQVFLNLDYVNGNDDDKVLEAGSTDRYSYNFKYPPKYNASAGVSHQLGNFLIAANVNYYGEMKSGFESIPADYVLNTTLGYSAGNLSHYLTVRNATNNNVTLPEYVRRTSASYDEVVLVQGIRVDYTFKARF